MKKPMLKQNNSLEQGFVALITALIILAVAITITTTLLLTGTDSLRTSNSSADTARARAASDSCTEVALKIIGSTPGFTTGAVTVNLPAPAGVSCTYTVSGSAPTKTIVATGTAGTSTKKVTTTTSQVAPTVVIGSSAVSP